MKPCSEAPNQPRNELKFDQFGQHATSTAKT
jgi:hypothetical protein